MSFIAKSHTLFISSLGQNSVVLRASLRHTYYCYLIVPMLQTQKRRHGRVQKFSKVTQLTVIQSGLEPIGHSKNKQIKTPTSQLSALYQELLIAMFTGSGGGHLFLKLWFYVRDREERNYPHGIVSLRDRTFWICERILGKLWLQQLDFKVCYDQSLGSGLFTLWKT